jgi:hypothetical protein
MVLSLAEGLRGSRDGRRPGYAFGHRALRHRYRRTRSVDLSRQSRAFLAATSRCHDCRGYTSAAASWQANTYPADFLMETC